MQLHLTPYKKHVLWRGFNTRNTGIVLMGVVSSLVMMLASLTGTASAAAIDCRGGATACFWYNANFSGLRADYYTNVANTCVNFSYVFNDQISSLVNRTGWVLMLYKDANCSNFIFGTNETYPYSNKSNLSGSGMNDTASSFMFKTGW